MSHGNRAFSEKRRKHFPTFSLLSLLDSLTHTSHGRRGRMQSSNITIEVHHTVFSQFSAIFPRPPPLPRSPSPHSPHEKSSPQWGGGVTRVLVISGSRSSFVISFLLFLPSFLSIIIMIEFSSRTDAIEGNYVLLDEVIMPHLLQR